MKSKFKVGDRVAVYDGQRLVGTVAEIYDGVTSTGDVRVTFKDKEMWYHHKQCRKLVKKEAREWKVYVFEDGTISSHASRYSTVFSSASTTNVVSLSSTVIRVREIRGKCK